jgi:hypothetical protein
VIAIVTEFFIFDKNTNKVNNTRNKALTNWILISALKFDFPFIKAKKTCAMAQFNPIPKPITMELNGKVIPKSKNGTNRLIRKIVNEETKVINIEESRMSLDFSLERW